MSLRKWPKVVFDDEGSYGMSRSDLVVFDGETEYMLVPADAVVLTRCLDMPEWWRERRRPGECPCVDCAAESRAAWRMFCRDVWRVLGLEEPNTEEGSE